MNTRDRRIHERNLEREALRDLHDPAGPREYGPPRDISRGTFGGGDRRPQTTRGRAR